MQVGPGQYVGQVALLPSDPAAAAVAASGAALTAALAGLPASGAAAVAGLTRKLSEDEFELYLEVRTFGGKHACSVCSTNGSMQQECTNVARGPARLYLNLFAASRPAASSRQSAACREPPAG